MYDLFGKQIRKNCRILDITRLYYYEESWKVFMGIISNRKTRTPLTVLFYGSYSFFIESSSKSD